MRNLLRRGRFLVPVLLLVAFPVLLPGAAIARQDPNADKTSLSRRGPSSADLSGSGERFLRGAMVKDVGYNLGL